MTTHTTVRNRRNDIPISGPGGVSQGGISCCYDRHNHFSWLQAELGNENDLIFVMPNKEIRI